MCGGTDCGERTNMCARNATANRSRDVESYIVLYNSIKATTVDL